MKTLSAMFILAMVGGYAQSEIIVTQATADISASAIAGSIVVDHSAQVGLNTQNTIQIASLWQNNNALVVNDNPQPYSEYSSSLIIDLLATEGNSEQNATISQARLYSAVSISVNQNMLLDSVCTAEGYVYRVAAIDLYIGTLGGGFLGGGSGTASFAFTLDVTSQDALLRTYLSEYSIAEGAVVEFNSHNASGAVAKITYDFQMSLDAESLGLANSRQINVYAVAPVPEPSAYAMTLASLACGGWSMWRRWKRA